MIQLFLQTFGKSKLQISFTVWGLFSKVITLWLIIYKSLFVQKIKRCFLCLIKIKLVVDLVLNNFNYLFVKKEIIKSCFNLSKCGFFNLRTLHNMSPFQWLCSSWALHNQLLNECRKLFLKKKTTSEYLKKPELQMECTFWF